MKTPEKILDIVIYFTVAAMLSLFIFACDKQPDGSGVILVTVKYNGKAVDYGKIIVKSGTAYEKVQEIDVYGQGWFADLPPGNYTVHAEQYSNTGKTYITGDAAVTVVSRYRLNEYDIKVELED